MSKNLRKRISSVLQTTFGFLPRQHKQSLKRICCCSVAKPNDYEYVSYQQKQTSVNHDYIDLNECYSLGLSYRKDSGILSNSNDSSSSSFSDLSSISSDQISNVTVQQSTFQCCRCQCHHYIKHDQLLPTQTNNYSSTPKKSEQRQIKTKLYPFIF